MRPAGAVVPDCSADAGTRPAGRVDLRLLAPALGAWAGAWIGSARPVSPPLGGLAACAAVATAVCLARLRPRRLVAVAALIGMAAGLGATALRVGAIERAGLRPLAARGALVRVGLVVTTDPVRRGQDVRFGRPVARTALDARTRWIEGYGGTGRRLDVRVPVTVLASHAAWETVEPSQRLVTDARVRPSSDPLVAAVLTVARPPTAVTAPALHQRWAGAVRRGLRHTVSVLPDEERGLLPGLVLGDTSRLDPGLRADFRTTGLSHLVAVSGANCGIVTAAVLGLAAALGAPLRFRAVLGTIALASFVVVARPSPSVLRAAAMGVIALVALGLGRPRAAWPALGATVFALVLLSPELARSAGFALSVTATAGLLAIAPRLAAALADRLTRSRPRLTTRLARPIAEAIAVATAAGVATAPLVAALSGAVSMVSIPANVLAAPAVPPATIVGALAAVAAPVAPPLAELLARVAGIPVHWLVVVARTGASWPTASLPWPPGWRGAALLAAVLLAVVALARSRRARRPLAVAAVAAALGAGAVGVVAPAWPPPGWRVVACDVGQGDALVLAAGPGAGVVVDAGPDPTLVDGCLRRLGVRSVPLLVLTHFHADHVAGLPGVLLRRPIGAALVSPLAEPAEVASAAVTALAAAAVPIDVARSGARLHVAGLDVVVLSPPAGPSASGSSPNDSSVVLYADVAGLRVLLPGDIEPPVQRSLIEAVSLPRADVVKVPHHGSAHQDADFLGAVGARLAITSVGLHNDYGHPAASTLARLSAAGARNLRTDHVGDVAVVGSGDEVAAVPLGRARSGARALRRLPADAPDVVSVVPAQASASGAVPVLISARSLTVGTRPRDERTVTAAAMRRTAHSGAPRAPPGPSSRHPADAMLGT